MSRLAPLMLLVGCAGSCTPPPSGTTRTGSVGTPSGVGTTGTTPGTTTTTTTPPIPCGEFAWLQRWTTSDDEFLTDIAVANDGDVLVTGYFARDLTIDEGGPNELLVPEGDIGATWDGVLAKVGPDGAVRWAATQVDTWNVWAWVVAVGPSGDVYAAGQYASEVTLDPGGPNEVTLPGVDSLEEGLWLARYDVNTGGLRWATSLVSGYGVPEDLTVAGDGSVYLAGSYARGLTLEPGGPDELVLPPVGTNDQRAAFVASWTSDGALRWAKSAGGELYDDYSSGVAVVADTLWFASHRGSASNPFTFGFGEPNETVLNPGFDWETPLAGLSTETGEVQWAQLSPGITRHLTAFDDGVILGGFAGGGSDGAQIALTDGGVVEIPSLCSLTGRLDANRAFTWAAGPEDCFSSMTYAVTHRDGLAATGGYYAQSLNFDPNRPVPGDPDSMRDAFVATWDADTGALQCAWGLYGPDNDDTNAVAIGPDGSVYAVGTYRGTLTAGAGTPTERTIEATQHDGFLVKFDPPPAVR